MELSNLVWIPESNIRRPQQRSFAETLRAWADRIGGMADQSAPAPVAARYAES